MKKKRIIIHGVKKDNGEKNIMGCELQEIIEAIEGSKSILNKLVSSCEEDLSNEETLRVSRELDELINIYNSVAQDRTESSQETVDFFMNEGTF